MCGGESPLDKNYSHSADRSPNTNVRVSSFLGISVRDYLD